MIKKILTSLLLLIGILWLTGCATTPPPRNINNVCSIFKQYPDWYKHSKRAQRKHGIPVHVQMAMIREESQFVSNAKPPRKKILWIIPGKHISSAYGYSQALDGTWAGYKRSTRKYFADRTNFADSVDFLSWYTGIASRHLKIPPSNAYDLYLAYHEGLAGYKRGSYRRKAWLKYVARNVNRYSNKFNRQLQVCERRLRKNEGQSKSWWSSFA